MDFNRWLGGLLGDPEAKVDKLLKDKSALHFMIAWSIFESKCFGGYVKIDGIQKFAVDLESQSFCVVKEINPPAHYFHNRYQDKKLLNNLMHSQACTWGELIINKNFEALTSEDCIAFVALVAYRFRNNMLYGNKKLILG